MELIHCKVVAIYEWPFSQMCMDCEHGEFIQSDTFDASNMMCHLACTENDGTVCKLFKQKDEE
jgi:hypothetical protein